jgi:hypothetical protein
MRVAAILLQHAHGYFHPVGASCALAWPEWPRKGAEVVSLTGESKPKSSSKRILQGVLALASSQHIFEQK